MRVTPLFAAALTFATSLIAAGWSPAGAQTSGRAFLRQMYGDVAVEAREAPGGALRLGVTDGKKTVTLVLMARDVRRWADSATRVLAARKRARDSTARWQAVAEGPGIAAGSITLARTIAPGDTTITFFAADSAFEAIRTNVTLGEARALVGAMRRAANAILNPPRPGRSGRGRGGELPP